MQIILGLVMSLKMPLRVAVKLACTSNGSHLDRDDSNGRV